MSEASPVRVITYVDGFNFYFGMRDKGWRNLLWLDFELLGRNLLKPGQQLVMTKYFTARISGPPDKVKRQGTFIEALETCPNFQLFEGHYQQKPVNCHSCGASWISHEEKMTDVNIATEMLTDAFEDCFDTALVMSGDSDLVPPIRAIRRLFPQKRVVAVFPPKRPSYHLAAESHGSFVVGRAKLAVSQFPDEVVKADGFKLVRPSHWT